jgi:hypothetical protein
MSGLLRIAYTLLVKGRQIDALLVCDCQEFAYPVRVVVCECNE